MEEFYSPKVDDSKSPNRYRYVLLALIVIFLLFTSYKNYYTRAVYEQEVASLRQDLQSSKSAEQKCQALNTSNSGDSFIPVPFKSTVIQEFYLLGNSFHVIKDSEHPSGNGEFTFYVAPYPGTSNPDSYVLWNTPESRGIGGTYDDTDLVGALGDKIFAIDQVDSVVKIYRLQNSPIEPADNETLKEFKLIDVAILPSKFDLRLSQIRCNDKSCIVNAYKSLGQGCDFVLNATNYKYISPAKCASEDGTNWTESF